MPNRVAPPSTFATTSPPWSLALLDANFANLTAATNDSSLGWMNGVPNDAGTVNNYSVTLPYGTPSAYNPGFSVTFIPAFTNTGASTVNINTLGPVPIVDVFGAALMGGLLVQGKAALIQYTGTNFRLLNSSQSGGVSYYYDYDDFIHFGATSNETKLLIGFGNSGAFGVQDSNVPGHPGLWVLQAGPNNYATLAVPFAADGLTAQAGSAVFLDGSTNYLMRSIMHVGALGTNGDFTFGLWSAHAAELASGTNQFVGFLSNLNRNASWLAYANASSSAVTSISTGIALTVGTWYTLELVYTASTGTVTFYINGASVATINTNLPTASVLPTFQIIGHVGATTYHLDTYEFLANPSIPNRFLYGAL